MFAKLLKGEYVATEEQMGEFFKRTLPSMAAEIGKMYEEEDKKKASRKTRKLDVIPPIKIITPTTKSSSEIVKPIAYKNKDDYNNYRDMNFEMNITVEGTLDKTVLPELKKSVIKEINKSLEKRGIKRTADSFAI